MNSTTKPLTTEVTHDEAYTRELLAFFLSIATEERPVTSAEEEAEYMAREMSKWRNADPNNLTEPRYRARYLTELLESAGIYIRVKSSTKLAKAADTLMVEPARRIYTIPAIPTGK